MLNIILVALTMVFSSCNNGKTRIYTPKAFLNHSVVKKEDYSRDSIAILASLRTLLKAHEGFFYAKEYYNSTELIIDSIIYSPDFSKLAVFVITKNPTSRQLMPDKKHEWYYNGTSYLGTRERDSLKLYWLGPNFSNSPDKKELSYMMRDTYFNDFASRDTTSTNIYKFNLNDVRFWDCAIWQRIKQDEIKKKEFEEEKKNHPENVYEPRNR
jgi:hypothetical protein